MAFGAAAVLATAFAQHPSAPQQPHEQWQSLHVQTPVSQQKQPLSQQAQQPSCVLAATVGLPVKAMPADIRPTSRATEKVFANMVIPLCE